MIVIPPVVEPDELELAEIPYLLGRWVDHLDRFLVAPVLLPHAYEQVLENLDVEEYKGSIVSWPRNIVRFLFTLPLHLGNQ